MITISRRHLAYSGRDCAELSYSPILGQFSGIVELLPLSADCAGITSSRSDVFTPIQATSPQPQGHRMLAGSITRSTRGRCGCGGTKP